MWVHDAATSEAAAGRRRRASTRASSSVLQALAEWVEQVHVELGAVPPNWDGYGADPPTKPAMEGLSWVLSRLASGSWNLPRPSVGPTRSGGVVLEWHLGRLYAALEVEADGTLGWYLAEGLDPRSPDEEVEGDENDLDKLLRRLEQPSR